MPGEGCSTAEPECGWPTLAPHPVFSTSLGQAEEIGYSSILVQLLTRQHLGFEIRHKFGQDFCCQLALRSLVESAVVREIKEHKPGEVRIRLRQMHDVAQALGQIIGLSGDHEGASRVFSSLLLLLVQVTLRQGPHRFHRGLLLLSGASLAKVNHAWGLL